MNTKNIKGKQSNLRRSPVAHACLTFSMLLAAGGANAAAGWGTTNDAAGAEVRTKTYYAHSPSGQRAIPVPAAEAPVGYTGNTGTALRKFVDQLPLVGAVDNKLSNGVDSKFIPVAKPIKWKNPTGIVTGDDYYEIAVVEYTEKMHSDLKPTRVRGYVQIDQEASNGRTPIVGSTSFPLLYPNGNAIMIPGTDANGKLTGAMVAALAVDKPHYLGPAIVAQRRVPTRLKFHNLLPVGRYDAATGRNGDLFLPVDETLAGAGVGPDGVTRYTQNRAEIHLHGGDNPWISDGTPHQWIAPAGERAVLGAEMAAAGSPLSVDTFLRGPGAQNVPDMNEPGEGAMTYYFPNEQSARLEWYHDHSYGLTRLNVYAGMVAPYVLNDAGQDTMLQNSITGFPADTIHLVIQDKTFVPDDIALQDARWNAKVDATGNHPLVGQPLWGEAGDMWYPHVYEVNQDPGNGLDGTNPVGRWDWGPYFWPVFPALYNLPTGGVGDVTLTPEAWMDTPVVNGVAYPTMNVEPRAQRFKILNGSNDRFWNLSFFVADSAVSEILVKNGGTGYTANDVVSFNGSVGTGAAAQLVVDGNGAITSIRVTNAGSGYSSVPGSIPTLSISSTTGSGFAADVVVADNTEVKMVPAVPADSSGLPTCATNADGVDIVFPEAEACWPSTWPTDGRAGGVPDPRTNGPKIYQIGSEGGLLPQVAEILPNPMQYEYNRRSITVLNAFATGLFMGNAERADVLVDFTGYEGKTLILYSDAPAPVPAFDPRNDHWTGKPDEHDVGSVETPRAGFGPNTRTVMQFKVGTSMSAAQAALTIAQDKLTAANTALAPALTLSTADEAARVLAQGKLTTATTSQASVQATFDAASAAFDAATPATPAYYMALATLANDGLALNAAIDATAAFQVAYDAAAAKAATSLSALTNAQLAVYNATAAVTLAQAGVTAAQGLPSYTPLDVAKLKTQLPKVYGNDVYGQERPIIAQSAYNAAFTENWSDAPVTTGPNAGTKAFATIFTGSLQEPTFRFTPGTPNGAFDKVKLLTGGSGYVTPPVPVIDAPAPGGVQATAVTTLRVEKVNILSAGAGYKFTPTVTFVNTGNGNGATGLARMQVSTVLIGNGGSGYDPLTPPVVTFSAPDERIANGITAVGTAVVDVNGVVTGVNITEPGRGYTSAPLVSIAAPTAVGGVRASASTELNIRSIDLISNDPNHPEFAGGGGYSSMAQITVRITPPTAPGAVPAVASVTGAVSDITLVNAGRGYTNGVLPAITIPAPAGGTAATAETAAGGGSILVKNKAIQELFDPTYGRMNATLGIEIPFTSAMTQTTIPLGYVDPVTEEFEDGETQIWKITHNGVDGHPVHFHLLNVQVINRVGWDGTIKPPHANEYGWKETVLMNPLEDIVVAVRAKKPKTPGFGLPFSQRLRDPSQPDGVPMGFTQINAVTGNPAVVTNQMDNFGWEYVWHCHILGHEENDFMRPIKFNANEAKPLAATGLNFAGNTLNWVDNATTEYKYQVYSVVTTGAGTLAASSAVTLLDSPLANATSSTLAAVNPAANHAVVAVGANGSTATLMTALDGVLAPTITGTSLTGTTTARLSFVDNATNEMSFAPEISADGGITWAALPAMPVTQANRIVNPLHGYNLDLTGLVRGTTYKVRVAAKGIPAMLGTLDMTPTSPYATTDLVFTGPDAPAVNAAPVMVRANANGTANPLGTRNSTTVNFTPAATGLAATGFRVQYALAATAAAQAAAPAAGWTTVNTVFGPAVTSVTVNNLARTPVGAKYWFRVTAVNPVTGNNNGTPSVSVLSGAVQ